MSDLSEILNDELLRDLYEGLMDIQVCIQALRRGVTAYSGGLVADRISTNKVINAKIVAELELRNIHVTPPPKEYL
jgi:hypothetical protein